MITNEGTKSDATLSGPNGPTVECPAGSHWDANIGACVADSNEEEAAVAAEIMIDASVESANG